MDPIEAQRDTRSGFNEIVAGYTPFRFRRNELFIKHFGAKDQIEIDSIYRGALEKLKERGVPTSEEKSKQLIRDKLWLTDDDEKMKVMVSQVEHLRKTKKLLFLKSQIEEQQKEIDKIEKDYLILLMKKNELFGKTAEFFANKRVSDHCVVNSIYNDASFSEPFFSKSSILDLDDEMMDEITAAYNKAVKKFEELNIKKIALSNLFQNYYYLSKSVYEFYGRAIVDLTFYQVQLVTFGDYYKNILHEGSNKPPIEVANDPEKLEEWITGAAHAKKVAENTIGKNDDGEGQTFTSLVGAKKEDLEHLGMKNKHSNTVSLSDKVREKGGRLDKKDLMALMGIK